MNLPISSATVIPLRQSGNRMEVYLLQKARNIEKIETPFVFPGGTVKPEDSNLNWFKIFPEITRETLRYRLSDVSVTESLAFHVAALRELFEEAGVLLMHGSMTP